MMVEVLFLFFELNPTGNSRWRQFLCSSRSISKNSWKLNIDKALNTAVSTIKTLDMGATRLRLNADALNLKASGEGRVSKEKCQKPTAQAGSQVFKDGNKEK